MKHLILIGGGGHCRSVIDVVEQAGEYAIQGILDPDGPVGRMVSGYPVIGGDQDIVSLTKAGYHFLVAVGQIKSASTRVAIFEQLIAEGASLATLVSPSALVSKNAKIGRGSVIMHGAVINAGAKVGENCIINTKAIIEHETVVGDHCHISTAAVVNGNCQIGNGVFVGSNSVVSQGRTIANACVIGAGAVIIRDISGQGETWVGTPGRRISR